MLPAARLNIENLLPHFFCGDGGMSITESPLGRPLTANAANVPLMRGRHRPLAVGRIAEWRVLSSQLAMSAAGARRHLGRRPSEGRGYTFESGRGAIKSLLLYCDIMELLDRPRLRSHIMSLI